MKVYQVKELVNGKRIAITNEIRSRSRAMNLRDFYAERRQGRVYVKRIRLA